MTRGTGDGVHGAVFGFFARPVLRVSAAAALSEWPRIEAMLTALEWQARRVVCGTSRSANFVLAISNA